MNVQRPILGGNVGHATPMQNGPFPRTRLTGWNTILAIRVGANNEPFFDVIRTAWFTGLVFDFVFVVHFASREVIKEIFQAAVARIDRFFLGAGVQIDFVFRLRRCVGCIHDW